MQISPETDGKPRVLKTQFLIIGGVIVALIAVLYIYQAYGSKNIFRRNNSELIASVKDTVNRDSVLLSLKPAVLDTVKYDELLHALDNGDSSGRWPVKRAYPLPGAIFPFNRIVAFYGNFYSKKMECWENTQRIPCLPNFRLK